MKYGASIPVYNRELYIGPFLEQMINLGVECVIALSDVPYVNEGKSEEKNPDKTLMIIEKFFPDVKVIKGFYPHHKDSLRAGIKELRDCDVVMVNDCDIFMTKEDWSKLFKFIEENYRHFDVFSYDFENISKEYYYDYRFGKGARRGGYPPIMGLKPNIGINTIVNSDGGRHIVWNDKSAMIHHMRFCKGKYGKENPLYNKEPSSDLKDYSPAPDEISDLLIKWEKIVESL